MKWRVSLGGTVHKQLITAVFCILSIVEEEEAANRRGGGGGRCYKLRHLRVVKPINISIAGMGACA